MNKSEIILKVFNKIFDTQFGSLDIERELLPEWDSMKHAELIIELQKELKVRFRTEDIVDVSNAHQFIGALERSNKK